MMPCQYKVAAPRAGVGLVQTFKMNLGAVPVLTPSNADYGMSINSKEQRRNSDVPAYDRFVTTRCVTNAATTVVPPMTVMVETLSP